MLAGYPTELLILATLVVGVAGYLRGLAGFGSGMLMAGPLAFIFGPLKAVAIIVILEAVISLPLLKSAKADVNKDLVRRLLVGAALTAPLGLWLVNWLPQRLAGQVISVLIIVAALSIAAGFKRKGQTNSIKEHLLGGASGFTCGLAGISGPPVVLYLLSGSHRALEVRASLIYYFALIDLYVVLGLALFSEKFSASVSAAALLFPVMWFTAYLGSKRISNGNHEQYKRWALMLIIIGNIASLISAVYS